MSGELEFGGREKGARNNDGTGRMKGKELEASQPESLAMTRAGKRKKREKRK
jgi:hypothetical protein